MNDLQRIEGKTIQSIDKEFDGKNSSIIIKFKEGDKVNISSYPNGDKGVGQFDVELGGMKEDDLIGKRIHSVTEEFDGTNDFLVFTFKDTSKMTITSFSSIEDSTAGLDISVYSSPNKLVAESLEELFENSYTDARNGQYPMHNPQYEEGEIPERKARELMEELEDWLEHHQIYDENEEIEEIESWLEINTEMEPHIVKMKLINLILRKYDINPSIIG